MRILVALLSAPASHYMIEHLREHGHEVTYALSVNDARSYLDNGVPDCLITDLTGSAQGLTQEQFEFAKDSPYNFSGWAWVAMEALKEHPELSGKIIFYSADIDHFRERFRGSDTAGVVFCDMRPGRPGGGAERLIKLIGEVAAKVAAA